MKKHNKELEIVKAARKKSREEEIKKHTKLINYQKIVKSKKLYTRKTKKADQEDLL